MAENSFEILDQTRAGSDSVDQIAVAGNVLAVTFQHWGLPNAQRGTTEPRTNPRRSHGLLKVPTLRHVALSVPCAFVLRS